MKIAITGSTGLVGSALIPVLTAAGHQVVRLVRQTSRTANDGTLAVPWDPEQGQLDASDLEGVDAVINLAGENIAGGRWTAARKKRILESRTKSTALLATTIAKMNPPPRFFFSASAVGYYPSSGDRVLTEADQPGTDFLADVCVAWETASRPAAEVGVRTVNGRIGVVLSTVGGALASQLPLFRWGIAGRLGSGKQYVPWITLDDLVRALVHCMATEQLQGPVNLTAPHPVTNAEFTKTLGKVLSRPTILPAPKFVLRMILGEMADSLLFASLRVLPERLLQTGFLFNHTHLEPALRQVLNKPG
jgi:uncharacterized protein (TIGR01777 family)